MSAPEQIGRYRVERRLGAGAFGVVWLAHDDRLDAPVAVKVMAENWSYRLDMRERFVTEARMLRRARSGGVVQVFDIGELPDERPYFVMEYADGGTLDDLLTAGVPALAESLAIVAQAARGAAALHEAGIVHRDIKPSNVLLSRGPEGRERVLLADLGLAKNLAQGSGLTVVTGSAGYMAPEQAEPFGGVDGRADVYSLGAVLHHLVTGTVPGPPGRVLPADEVREGVPRSVRRAVTRAMETDRERRWPTAAAFADELDRLAGQVAGVAGSVPAGGPVPPRAAVPRARRARRSWSAAAVATAVVVVLGTGAALTWAEHQHPPEGTERVRDATGTVSVAVPSAWARQVTDTGWSPRSIGLPDAHRPGLTVSQDARHWPDLTRRVEGLFVGTGPDGELAAKVAAISHGGCTYRGSRAYTDASWHGTVRTWSDCRAAGQSLEEIALSPRGAGLPGVYVQIRSTGRDRTDSVLRSLRVTG